jgi:cell division protein FtsW
VVQALMNLSVVLSLAPNKGIPLPFISYGSSSLIASLASLGLLLAISKEASE